MDLTRIYRGMENGQNRLKKISIKLVQPLIAPQELSKNHQKEPLWTGAWYGGAAGNGQVPSKSLSQCENGWILQWQEYTKEGALNGACYHFS